MLKVSLNSDHNISYDNVLNAAKALHLDKADGIDPIF